MTDRILLALLWAGATSAALLWIAGVVTAIYFAIRYW